MNRRYYVYAYFDKDETPFYIGKGVGYRYRVSCHLNKANTNHFLKNKFCKIGRDHVEIRFLHKDLTEKEAFLLETLWIKYYGRRDKKEGTLCNLTDGGDGPNGIIVSTETKQKTSEALKGHTVHEKTRQRISKALKGHQVSRRTRQKLSKIIKGRPNLINRGKPSSMKGKIHSDATKRKMSTSSKGKNSGKRHSAETKRKISVAAKRMWALRNGCADDH